MPRPKLRTFQRNAKGEIYQAWNEGAVDVGFNSPTGSGKTVTFADIMNEHNGASLAIAHRQELVSQASLALARNDIRHRIVTNNKPLIKNVTSIHIAELGHSYYDANARIGAAGVDSLNKLPPDDPIFLQTTLPVFDEGHHVLRTNKWGKCRQRFRNPNVRALHVSATWTRADGAGHGRHADGFIDRLINAPTMRDLIDRGYLTDYVVYTPKTSDLDLSHVDISSSTGDLNMHQLCEATKASRFLVGDIVKHYLLHAKGKLGVTFACDVEEAVRIAAAYKAAGVPAEVVSAGTPDHLRIEILRKFKRRQILQLVNVDIFGEGFDLPAIEVVSFGRATESWSLFCQQWGRVLRLMIGDELAAIWDDLTPAQRKQYIAASEKPFGIVIDHVGNIFRHMGPPDKVIAFSLDRRERRSKGSRSDAIPLRMCENLNANGTGLPCDMPYERVYKCCPHCGFFPLPADRSAPEFVDGDLFLLPPDVLARMRGAVATLDGSFVAIPKGVSDIARRGIENRHYENQQSQASLRIAIAWWGGLQDALGRPDQEEKYRRFYLLFGVDVLTAQALPSADAEKLRTKICESLLKHGVDGTVNYAIA